MANWKQAGFTFNKYLAIAAKTVRQSLKEDLKIAAEKRSFTEAKKLTFEKGIQKDVTPLSN